MATSEVQSADSTNEILRNTLEIIPLQTLTRMAQRLEVPVVHGETKPEVIDKIIASNPSRLREEIRNALYVEVDHAKTDLSTQIREVKADLSKQINVVQSKLAKLGMLNKALPLIVTLGLAVLAAWKIYDLSSMIDAFASDAKTRKSQMVMIEDMLEEALFARMAENQAELDEIMNRMGLSYITRDECKRLEDLRVRHEVIVKRLQSMVTRRTSINGAVDATSDLSRQLTQAEVEFRFMDDFRVVIEYLELKSDRAKLTHALANWSESIDAVNDKKDPRLSVIIAYRQYVRALLERDRICAVNSDDSQDLFIDDVINRLNSAFESSREYYLRSMVSCAAVHTGDLVPSQNRKAERSLNYAIRMSGSSALRSQALNNLAYIYRCRAENSLKHGKVDKAREHLRNAFVYLDEGLRENDAVPMLYLTQAEIACTNLKIKGAVSEAFAYLSAESAREYLQGVASLIRQASRQGKTITVLKENPVDSLSNKVDLSGIGMLVDGESVTTELIKTTILGAAGG